MQCALPPWPIAPQVHDQLLFIWGWPPRVYNTDPFFLSSFISEVGIFLGQELCHLLYLLIIKLLSYYLTASGHQQGSDWLINQRPPICSPIPTLQHHPEPGHTRYPWWWRLVLSFSSHLPFLKFEIWHIILSFPSWIELAYQLVTAIIKLNVWASMLHLRSPSSTAGYLFSWWLDSGEFPPSYSQRFLDRPGYSTSDRQQFDSYLLNLLYLVSLMIWRFPFPSL